MNLLPFVCIFGVILHTTAEKISDLRLCADRNCETLISSARSLARHKPKDPSFLPFERGEVVLVYSKSAGSRPDLWAGECNGKKGYFPRSFVREYKVEQPNPTHEVPTELFNFEERTANQAPQQEKPPPSPKEAEPAKSEVEKDETDIDDTELSDDTEVDESDEQEEKPDAQLGEETEPSNQAKEEIQRKEETEKIQQKDKQDGRTVEDTKEVEIDETETAEDETDVGGDEVDEGKETADSGASTDSAHQMDATKTGTETDDSVDETELDDDDDDDELLDDMDYNEDKDDAIDDGQKKDDDTAVKKDKNKVDEEQTKQQTVTSQTEEHQATESEMGTQTQKMQDTEAAKNEEPKSENAEGGGSIFGSMFNAVKNTIIHPFGGKTEQEPQKSDDVTSESDNNTKEAESDAERKLGESQRDKEREVSSDKIDTDSLKFTNIFEKDDDSLDNKGDSLVEEMKQSAETAQISSDQSKQDSVKEDSKINTGDPETEVHRDDKPRGAVTETETDSAGKPDDPGKTDVNTEGKKVDDLIDSLDISKEQDVGQEQTVKSEKGLKTDQKSGEIFKEGDAKMPSASADVESETVEYKAKRDGYQTYSIQADMTNTPTPTKATTNEQSLQTDSKETEESGIVVDGTVLPADYFGDEDTEKTATVAQYNTQSVEPTPSHTVQESVSTQLETTSDAISDIHPSQTTKQASLEVKESTVIKHTEQSSDNADQTTGTYDLQSSATTDVKNIEPSKTVLEQSASSTEQTDLKSEVVSPQRSLYVDQNTDAKPFVMHDTILRPSTTYSEWNTDDLKKYETPYQPSSKILPLNQGVDVNNRYTPSVIQSSIVESSLQETVARTESYSSAVQAISEASSAIIESDILTQVMDKKENLTVQSDLVQDQVQPSLSQDAYRTADFASRKMLSAEGTRGSLNAEQQQKEQLQGQGHQHQVPIQDQESERPGHLEQEPLSQPPAHTASTQNQGNEQQLADTQSQQLNIQNQGTTQKPDTFEPEVPPTLRPKFDENNNLDENNNYDIDPRLTRTMPNEKIDEEFPTPVTISQRMEPQLKFLVDMVNVY